MSTARMGALDRLAERIGHDFRSPRLLERALTHSSFAAGRDRVHDYERLEFLGDRILGLVIAEMLFNRFPHMNEGELALRLNALVRKETCAEVARDLDLGDHLRLGSGELSAGGREKTAILANVCEAVVAAIYLDGGLDAARAFIGRAWARAIETVDELAKDPKSALQEWAQARGFPPPDYVEVTRKGPDHAPSFTVRVEIGAERSAKGEGQSKRIAEQAAAEALLRKLSDE